MRSVRQVGPDETLNRMRLNLVEIATTLEAFRVMYEDGIEVDPDKAQRELEVALALVRMVHSDTFGDSQEDELDTLD